MRRLFLFLLLLSTACGTGEPTAAPPPPAPTEYVRTPQDCAKLTVTAATVETGIGYILGTHAEWQPKGQFIRIRVAIVNNDNTFHTTRPADYHLEDTAAAAHPPSVDAMAIKRQSPELTLGAGNRLEMDLWYDIPPNAGPRQLRDTVCATIIPLPS
ncbi:hypothetical protein F5X71_07065 [Nocardia brasiliensis]|uniref:DUF4352 domain-containing protein n=1 Tax=Nocardia brasiliensis TaxID=37326 RepID=A0A6G9XMN0_NOCBR|nr:DUF4352 domain-containing protein [Nocardia brasiliensis]QIS02110.1 hypothetical protein F5X71_07065 [Nocardia brasiliensis]